MLHLQGSLRQFFGLPRPAVEHRAWADARVLEQVLAALLQRTPDVLGLRHSNGSPAAAALRSDPGAVNAPAPSELSSPTVVGSCSGWALASGAVLEGVLGMQMAFTGPVSDILSASGECLLSILHLHRQSLICQGNPTWSVPAPAQLHIKCQGVQLLDAELAGSELLEHPLPTPSLASRPLPDPSCALQPMCRCKEGAAFDGVFRQA